MKYKLKDIADVIDPNPSHRAPKEVENGVPFAGIGDVDYFGQIRQDNIRKVSHEVLNEQLKNFLIDEKTIGYGRVGTVGKVVSLKNREFNAYTLSPTLCIINPKYGFNPYYIRAYIESNYFYSQVYSRITGSTRPTIGIQQLRDLIIDIPDKKTEEFIGNLWKYIYDKIELNNKINDNLQQQAFALFEEKFPNIRDGEFRIGDYLSPKRGKNLLTKDAVLGNVPVVAGGLEPSTYHNKPNTGSPVITISASGANAGFVNLWNDPVWSSDSSFIDESITRNVYFWYVLLKKRQKEIYDSQTGSAQAHIYPKHIEVMPMAKINDDCMNGFNELVSPLFMAIGKNNIQNKKLSELRDTLLPKLMSGEIDVDSIEL